jgi:hypothetical protein
MPKPRNRRADFKAQITKPKMSVLRPKPENPSPSWFWGSTKKLTTGFEAKPGETIATSFKIKLEKTIATGFEAKQRKPSEWFWGQTTHKSSTLVLRLNQETRASRLHVHGADHTRCHPTTRLPAHRVPDLCDHPRSSASGLVLLSWSSSLHVMPHLPPAHHKTSKHNSPNETMIKKQNELSQIRIQSSSNQWLITIKLRNWPLGFSIFPLMSPLTTKAQSLKFES